MIIAFLVIFLMNLISGREDEAYREGGRSWRVTVEIKKKLDNFRLDISFRSDARRIGILGASGCGKEHDAEKHRGN